MVVVVVGTLELCPSSELAVGLFDFLLHVLHDGMPDHVREPWEAAVHGANVVEEGGGLVL